MRCSCATGQRGLKSIRQAVLAESFDALLAEAGISEQELAQFAEAYNNEMNAILLFSEKEISGNTAIELLTWQ